MPVDRAQSKKSRKMGEHVILSVSNFASTKRAVYISAKSAFDPCSSQRSSAKLCFNTKHDHPLTLGQTLVADDDDGVDLHAVPCVTFVCCMDPGRALDLVTYPKHQEIEISKLSFVSAPVVLQTCFTLVSVLDTTEGNYVKIVRILPFYLVQMVIMFFRACRSW